jgi:hypothetical protein
MNEPELQKALRAWMHEERAHASAWVLEGVSEHAHRRSNRTWWRRLITVTRRGVGVAEGDDRITRRQVVSLTAVVASAMAVLLVLPMALPAQLADPRQGPATGTGAQGVRVGLTGSVWLEQSEGAPDHYITLHADGTVVERVDGSQTTAGIGVWQPTGEHSLSSVILYMDADPAEHVTPGFTTQRANWSLDSSNESGSLSWRATLQDADGGVLPDVTGNAVITRLHLETLPGTARYPIPEEQPWELAIGSMAEGPGSGEVAAVGDVNLSAGHFDMADPMGYFVLHGDGTILLASLDGIGAGLWASSGPDTSALTLWSELRAAEQSGSWVAEKRGRLVLTGDTDAFGRRFVASPRHLKPMDGRQLPPLDPVLWPTEGSVWLQPTGDATAIVAYLTDGTVVARHPTLGTGAGSWQSTGNDSRAASVFFATVPGQDHHLLWEATIGPDEQHMSIEYELKDANSGAVETRAVEANRLRLEP